jgi:hypothetical protein
MTRACSQLRGRAVKRWIAGIAVLAGLELSVSLSLGCSPKNLDRNWEARESFMRQVVATGQAGVVHTKRVGRIEYRATPTDSFVDDSGRTCRNVHLVQIEKGAWKDMGDHFFCRENGQWTLDDG